MTEPDAPVPPMPDRFVPVPLEPAEGFDAPGVVSVPLLPVPLVPPVPLDEEPG